jgi:hypothetical protein
LGERINEAEEEKTRGINQGGYSQILFLYFFKIALTMIFYQ